MKLVRTFKLEVFNKISIKSHEESAVKEVHGHITVNPNWCDLRPIHERIDKDTKEVTPSCVENILIAESILTSHYAKEIDGVNTLYDFITLDYSGCSEYDSATTRIKDLTCEDGIYIPLDKLESVGYKLHDEAECITLFDVKYVKYRLLLQSASENRQCKVTFSTYKWDGIVRNISANAEYLNKSTQVPQKAIARLGLAKSSGTIVNDFDFSFTLVDDLMTDIEFDARCYYDAENTIKNEKISTSKCATDGHGWITPNKAKELADILGLNYVPSAFQVRYGQVKGLLLVFDYVKYSSGRINQDVIFTRSMWKSDFDISKAQLLIGNVSKRQRRFCEWNYQAFISLNNQLSYDDVLPHLEHVREYMSKALNSPEDALQFLGLLADIEDYNNVSEHEDNGYNCSDYFSSVDRLSAVIRANPQLAMQTKWVRKGIKKRIDLTTKKMLSGKIPMPDSSIAIMGTDPLAFFNSLKYDDTTGFNFNTGDYVVPEDKHVKPLQAGEFYYNNFEDSVLAMRNPLTHHAQIRKLNCVTNQSKSYWYRHLNQLILFNDYDETNLAMGGADFDGDFCIITKLFIDKFKPTPYIIYNNNNLTSNEEKQILTEEVIKKTIRNNLNQNMLGVIVNLNSRIQELLNDSTTLRRFVALAGYSDNPSFISDKTPQMPYYNHFKDVNVATAFLNQLNHCLTTLSELEIDKAKTGYSNNFSKNQKEYEVPFTPLWFGKIKGTADRFLNRPTMQHSVNSFGERCCITTKHCTTTSKSIIDTLKNGRYGFYEQRTIEMFAENNSIMGCIYSFINNQILGDGLMPDTPNYSINASLINSSILNIDEIKHIYKSVKNLYKQYCRSIAVYCELYNERSISAEDFENALESIINNISLQMREISSDRIALAYTAYIISNKSNNSGSFVFLTVLDGFTALLDSVKTRDFYRISLNDIIPNKTTHVIVYRNKFRLPESIDPSKSYFGTAHLPNGSYEIHRDLKGHISLIIPKPSDKSKLNPIPFAPNAEFSIKVSYKLSELCAEHCNGEYVSNLLSNACITFKEITSQDNIQYGVFAGDSWIGTIFDDQRNKWVLAKDIISSLTNREFNFVSTPEIKGNKGIDNNSTVTSTGAYRTAQILTFKQI